MSTLIPQSFNTQPLNLSALEPNKKYYIIKARNNARGFNITTETIKTISKNNNGKTLKIKTNYKNHTINTSKPRMFFYPGKDIPIEDVAVKSRYIVIQNGKRERNITVLSKNQTTTGEFILQLSDNLLDSDNPEKIFTLVISPSRPQVFFYSMTPLNNKNQTYKNKKIKTNNVQKPYIPCEKDLYGLHQVSGQCWNDAAIIFLWLASGIGRIVQERLQDPNLLEEFQTYIQNENIKAQLIAMYPDVTKFYNEFAYELGLYLEVMIDRFKLWRDLDTPKKAKPFGTKERKLSQNFSLCGEQPGIVASDYLFRVRRLKWLLEKQGPQNITYASGRGQVLQNFANDVFILIHFFLKGNVKMLLYHEENGEFTNQREYKTYLKLLTNQNDPVFIHNPFGVKYLFRESFYKATALQDILQNEGKGYYLNMLVSLENIYDENGHAATFLTCEDGSSYIYDDNIYKLKKINWPTIYKNVDLNYTNWVYIPFSKRDNSTYSLCGVSLPNVYPCLVRLTLGYPGNSTRLTDPTKQEYKGWITIVNEEGEQTISLSSMNQNTIGFQKTLKKVYDEREKLLEPLPGSPYNIRNEELPYEAVQQIFINELRHEDFWVFRLRRVGPLLYAPQGTNIVQPISASSLNTSHQYDIRFLNKKSYENEGYLMERREQAKNYIPVYSGKTNLNKIKRLKSVLSIGSLND